MTDHTPPTDRTAPDGGTASATQSADGYPDNVVIGHYRTPTLPESRSELTDDGEATLPLRGEKSILTGRAFLTGKSGAGKSNSVNVVAEEILRANRPLAIIDTDGEYFGLKEEFEMLHVGADEECDLRVGPEHGEKLAELTLEQNVPLIIDISGFLDESDADELLLNFTRTLFGKAKRMKKPFPLIVEEAHEYIPQKGSAGDLGRMLVKIGKRGRKHGLGLIAVSQRPASVDKDYITQCNWIVWHRLTWNNDTRVASEILGSGFGDAIEDLNDGEAFLMADWVDAIRRVKFRRQDTYDAGSTPTLEGEEVPELKTVSDDLIDELESTGERHESLEDELEQVREERDELRERVEELEESLATRDHAKEEFQASAQTFAEAVRDALSGVQVEGEADLSGPPSEWTLPDHIRADVMEVVQETASEEIAELEAELEDREDELEAARDRIESLEATVEEKEATIEDLREQVSEYEELAAEKERLEQQHEELREVYHRLGDALGVETDEDAAKFRQRAQQEQHRADELAAILRGEKRPEEASVEVDVDETLFTASETGVASEEQGEREQITSISERMTHPEVQARVEEASENTKAGIQHVWDTLYVLSEIADGDHPLYADQEGERPTAPDLADDRNIEVASSTVYEILKALADQQLVITHEQGPTTKNTFGLNRELLERLDTTHDRRQGREEFREAVQGDR